MTKNLGLLRKLGILATLLFCLGWVSFSVNTQSASAARPCCSECPIPPGDVDTTPPEYCENECGATSGACYDYCINRIYSCWRWCSFGC